MCGFAAVVRHSLGVSKSADARLGTGLHRDLGPIWQDLSIAEKDAILLETHEFQHHRLLHSTPLGVLLWRICQVTARDVLWLLSRVTDQFPQLLTQAPIRTWFSSDRFRAYLELSSGRDKATLEYMQDVAANLDRLLRLQAVLYGRKPGIAHAGMTRADLCDLLNQCFAYLAMRCDIPWERTWKTQLGSSLLFPTAESANARDLIEVDGTAMELWRLRAFGDSTGFAVRNEAALSGPYGPSHQRICTLYRADGEFAFSPFRVMTACLVACGGALDVAGHDRADPNDTLWIEDHLPWLRVDQIVADGGGFRARTLARSAAYAADLSSGSFIGAGSRWLSYYPAPFASAEHMVVSCASAGIELQLHILKKGLSSTFDTLSLLLVHKGDVEHEAVKLAARERADSDGTTLLVVEFSDGVRIIGPDDPIPQTHPLFGSAPHEYLRSSLFLSLGNLLLGVQSTGAIAAYEGTLAPNGRERARKLAAWVHQDLPEDQALHRWAGILELFQRVADPVASASESRDALASNAD